MIRLVETWDRNGQVTLPAVLAQARAFLSLRLMDRAWVRLREAGQRAPDSPDVLALTARVFVERGWPGRARRLVDQLAQVAPDHPDLARLQDQVLHAPQRPPANAREIERSANPTRLLKLAETYLATGSFLRAKSILERVRRVEPMNRRVEVLLWGLQGDFVPRGRSLGDLLSDFGPHNEWEASEHTESVRRADLGAVDPPTAEVSRATLEAAGLAEPGAADAFPSLFRQVETGSGQGGIDLDDEVTAAAGLASTEQLQNPPLAEHTDPGHVAVEGGGDTQIMQVIPGPGGGVLAAVRGPIHTPADRPNGLKETLNLRAWQESMGMSGASVDEAPPDEEDFLEAEDQDLVVMTRREESNLVAPEEPHRAGPIEVIEKHPQPPVPPQPPAPQPAGASMDAVGKGPESVEDVADLVEAARPERQWNRVALLVLLMALTMAAATTMVVRYLHIAAAQQQLEDAERVLAAGDYRGLLELEARLDGAVEARVEPLEARALALAMVEAVLWGEYTGNPAQHQRAKEALSVALESGAGGVSLALAEGTLALMDGDLLNASRHSAIAGLGTESSRYLAARVALGQGDPKRALSLWDAVDAVGAGGVRHRLLHAEALTAAADPSAESMAQRLIQSAPDNVLVAVADATYGWSGGTPDRRLARIQDTIDAHRDDLAPRQLAALLIARARILDDAERPVQALAAWQQAAAVDRTNPTALYHLGAVANVQHHLIDAEHELSACVEFDPFSKDCRRGLVQTRIDLDRLDGAAQAAAGWSGDPAVGVPLVAWVAIARGDVGTAIDSLVGVVESGESSKDGLAVYLLGVALASQEDGDARAERALMLAQQTLSKSSDPLDRALAARAAARRALQADKGTVDLRIQEALALAPEDPGVHVLIAQRYEQDGRLAAARQHLNRATALAPESALAWYGLGQFLFAPATMRDALSAWRRYRGLHPNGPRADRVLSKLQ
ncbi:MAG: tetratricopeptide repeat protein [Oligoflexia bacterium]|nr:tetratricopeptide repeat protein [Oligoflexia bacterium]